MDFNDIEFVNKFNENDVNELKKEVEFTLNKFNFKFDKENKNDCINRRTCYRLLILYTNLDFITIVNKVNQQFNHICSSNQQERDIMQYLFKLICLSKNIPLDKIKSRYSDNFDQVEERMLFRIELYKAGWTVEQIEKYIYKYMIKEVCQNLNKTKYEQLYFYLMKVYNMCSQRIQNNKIGRPRFPQILKDYNKSKHLKKVKAYMKEKYNINNKYNEIKKYFFTNDEISKIKENITDINILEKVEKLKVC